MSNAIQAFILGITVGFGPCLLLCGPIVISYVAGTKDNWVLGLKTTLVFSISRIIPYLILGFCSGMAGKKLLPLLDAKVYPFLRILPGIFTILLAFIIILGNISKNPLCLIFDKAFIGNKDMGLIAVGVLMGFMPCAPLVGLLSYITFGIKDPIAGIFYSFLFGLGTIIPILPFGGLAGKFSSLMKDNKKITLFLKLISGVILFVWGLNIIFS